VKLNIVIMKLYDMFVVPDKVQRKNGISLIIVKSFKILTCQILSIL